MQYVLTFCAGIVACLMFQFATETARVEQVTKAEAVSALISASRGNDKPIQDILDRCESTPEACEDLINQN